MSAQTIAAVKQFVQEGGTVIAIGSAAGGAVQQFGLPATNHLVENEVPLPREKFYVPGAVLRVAVDDTNPLAAGLGKELDVFFDNNPVFKLAPDAAAKGLRRVAWFADAAPLRSGWAWGQQYLDKGCRDDGDVHGPGPGVHHGARSALPIAAAWQLQAVLQRPLSLGRRRRSRPASSVRLR